MSIVALLLQSSTQKDENNQPVALAATFAIWDTSTPAVSGYLYNVGGIPLASNVQTYLNTNAASLFPQAQSGGTQLPASMTARAQMFAANAPAIFAAGGMAAILAASSVYASLGPTGQADVQAMLTAAATTIVSFQASPGLVL